MFMHLFGGLWIVLALGFDFEDNLRRQVFLETGVRKHDYESTKMDSETTVSGYEGDSRRYAKGGFCLSSIHHPAMGLRHEGC